MKELLVIKIGGNLLDDPACMDQLGEKLAALGKPFILVHGGGKEATKLAERLDIPQQMSEGRRITDAATLDIAVMVYAGLINKRVVALLQKNGCNALGLSGADASVVLASKRKNSGIDFGYVGDITENGVKNETLSLLIENDITPVFCAITHDGAGQLLNTNADSMAGFIAGSMSREYNVRLVYLFEKAGVLRSVEDESSVFPQLSPEEITSLAAEGIINKGMLPKLKNAVEARQKGVKQVIIGSFLDFEALMEGSGNAGTSIGL